MNFPVPISSSQFYVGIQYGYIILPSGITFSDNLNPVMSPNGLKIFFTAGVYTLGNYGDLYSCNPDGSSVTKIVATAGGSEIILGGAY